MNRYWIVFFMLIFLTNAGCTRALSQEEKLELQRLQASQTALDAEIGEATRKDSQFTGGLVKGLTTARLEVLQVSRDLLQQRILALESGAKIKVSIQGTEPDAAKADRLAVEIEQQQEVVKETAEEAARYNGGLTSAMKQATLAAEQQTLALLRQSYLMAKHGLFYPVGSGSNASPATREQSQLPTLNSTSTDSPLSSPGAPSQNNDSRSPQSSFEIVDIDTRITESNSSWSKFAWQLTVRNLTDSPMRFKATIDFLDGDGFVVDDDTEHQLLLAAKDEQVFRGYALIDADIAGNVSQVNAKVEAY